MPNVIILKLFYWQGRANREMEYFPISFESKCIKLIFYELKKPFIEPSQNFHYVTYIVAWKNLKD